MDNNKKQLVLQNLGLVGKIAKQYINQEYEYEDLFQTGCIGLIKAANNYSQDCNTKFTSYAYIKIYGEIKVYIRDNYSIKLKRSERFKNKCKVCSFDDESIFINGIPLKNAIKDSSKLEETALNKVIAWEIKKHISSFPKEQQKALILKTNGKTQEEISKILNISRPRAAYLVKKSLKILREQFGIKDYCKEKMKDKVVRLCKEGKSLSQIANLLGVTTNYVSTCKCLYKGLLEMRG